MYDNRKVKRYSMEQVTMTGSNVLRSFTGPKGKKGRLLNWGIDGISTSTAGATNTPQVKVGTAATDNAFGLVFDVGVLTAPQAKSVESTYDRGVAADRTSIAALAGSVGFDIPANTLVQMTLVVATGAGAAGVGNPFMEIAWDD